MKEAVMMVTEVPTDNELLGLDTETFEPDSPEMDEEMDMDEQLMFVALFIILSKLYTDFEHKSVDYVYNKFPDAVTKAGKKLAETSKTELTKIVEENRVSILKEFKIHEKVIPKVKLDLDLKPTFNTLSLSVKATINQLKDDVATKAASFKAGMAVPEDFNLKANFTRSVKRTKQFVKYNAQFAKQKITRAAQKMRYGSGMLYFWVVAGRRTCQKCYDLARLPPRPIDQWQYDHPNGHCKLSPQGDESTKEYQGYLALSQKYADLSLI